MVARWSQENFFKYLIQDYDFDKMVSFGVEAVDLNKTVVNPKYRAINYQLKKLREKKQRIESKFYPLVEQAMDSNLDEIPVLTNKHMEYKILLEQYGQQEKILLKERKKLSPRIKIEQAPGQERYNKLKTESKILMNVIKMICCKAESTVASLLLPYLENADKEKRMIIKHIIQTNADIIPDYNYKTLTVVLYSLSANRYNYAAHQLADILNQTETIFPGTDWLMKFKISANSYCER